MTSQQYYNGHCLQEWTDGRFHLSLSALAFFFCLSSELSVVEMLRMIKLRDPQWKKKVLAIVLFIIPNARF